MSKRAIVCDTGTGYLKIGWAGDSFPAYSIPTMVGRPMLRYDEKIEGVQLKKIMIGDEAAPLRSMLELSYPLEEGIIKSWDDIEHIWNYAFRDKMNLDLKEERILMTEAALNPKKNRKTMCEIMFEKFEVGQMQVGMQALLALYADGLLTACVLDSGDGVTHTIPIIEGNLLNANFIERVNIAGRHVTTYLADLLLRRGYAFNSTADFETVREIKEKTCFVSCDIDLDRKLSKNTTCHLEEYRLPDTSLIKIEKERFEAPELLFNPMVGGFEKRGVHELVFECIKKCPTDTRAHLYGCVYLSGGTTMFSGFPTRLENEIVTLYRSEVMKDKEKDLKIAIDVVDSSRRKYNVFIGGGLYAGVLDSGNSWISRNDWNENGEKAMEKLMNNITL